MENYALFPSPCYVIEETKLERNLKLLSYVNQAAGVEIILALKGFANWNTFPLVMKYLSGATASSLAEARLCHDEMGVKAHTYAVGYKKDEMSEYLALSSHLTFNSLSQYESINSKSKENADVSFGIRINPRFSDVATDLYNPSAPASRLGVQAEELKDGLPEGIDGLHFHVLCESNSYTLEKTLEIVERDFPKALEQAKWLNMGGGHLITGDNYDVDHLVSLLKAFQLKHNLELILEPGSAVAWQTGVLVSEVIDIVENGGVKTAILDVSFTCHMPDCLEMPYRPEIFGAEKEKPNGATHAYRLGGLSCLAGDYLEEYFFEHELNVGDRVIFDDMIHYTTVKTNMFNGIAHPSIGKLTKDGRAEVIREFNYNDYKNRLS